jgi:hypothetical protein
MKSARHLIGVTLAAAALVGIASLVGNDTTCASSS